VARLESPAWKPPGLERQGAELPLRLPASAELMLLQASKRAAVPVLEVRVTQLQLQLALSRSRHLFSAGPVQRAGCLWLVQR
jgi:hypothetical protein